MSWIPCALWAIQKSSIINCNFIWINYSLVYEVFGGFLFFLEAHKGNNEKWLQNLFVLHAGRNIVCLCAYADIKQTTLWSCVVRSRLQVPARHRKKQNAIKIKGAVQDCRIFVGTWKGSGPVCFGYCFDLACSKRSLCTKLHWRPQYLPNFSLQFPLWSQSSPCPKDLHGPKLVGSNITLDVPKSPQFQKLFFSFTALLQLLQLCFSIPSFPTAPLPKLDSTLEVPVVMINGDNLHFLFLQCGSNFKSIVSCFYTLSTWSGLLVKFIFLSYRKC